MWLVLVNPNTSVSTTDMMVGIARAAGPDAEIDGLTAQAGEPLITNPMALAAAADAVEALAPELVNRQPDGLIIAAFGDPGLLRLRNLLRCPVTGIAEAAMAEAGQGGRRFAVVTTTPELAPSIAEAAESYGHGSLFAGTALTAGDPVKLMADPARLAAELAAACRRAVTDLRAQVIVIGGGPLALAARQLRSSGDVPIVEPIPAAVRLAMTRARPA